MTVDRSRLALIDHEEMAELLRVKSDWLYRHQGDLIQSHGFPAPLEAFGQKKWDPVAVRRWLDSKMAAHLRTDPANQQVDGGTVPIVIDKDLSEEMAARAELLRGGARH